VRKSKASTTSSDEVSARERNCRKRRRKLRRFKQLSVKAKKLKEKRDELRRLLGTMRKHVERIQEEAAQGDRALNATRSLEEVAKTKEMQEEQKYQKVLADLTRIVDILKAGKNSSVEGQGKRPVRSSFGPSEPASGKPVTREEEPAVHVTNQTSPTTHTIPANTSMAPSSESNVTIDSNRATSWETVSFSELSAQDVPAASDESFQKGHGRPKKAPCKKARLHMPGAIDSVEDLGSLSNIGAEAPSALSTTMQQPESIQNISAPDKNTAQNLTTETSTPTQPVNGTEESRDSPALPVSTSLPPSSTLPEETITVPTNETFRGAEPVVTTTTPLASAVSSQQARAEAWVLQEHLALQLANISRTWERAKNQSRALLKACLVAEDAARQLHEAETNHFKAIELVMKQFAEAQVNHSRARHRVRIAWGALEHTPHCRKTPQMRRDAELERKLKEAEADLAKQLHRAKAQENATTPLLRKLEDSLATLSHVAKGWGVVG